MVKFWREAAVFEALVTRYRFHFYSIVSLGSVLDEVIVFAVGSYPKVKCELRISVTRAFLILCGMYSPLYYSVGTF